MRLIKKSILKIKKCVQICTTIFVILVERLRKLQKECLEMILQNIENQSNLRLAVSYKDRKSIKSTQAVSYKDRRNPGF